MTRPRGWWAGVVGVLSILTTNTAAAQLMSTCVADSPERRGEIDCSIIQTKPLPGNLTEPVFWHIDRSDSADRARPAVGPASIAFDAARIWGLMTIEPQTTDHHGGQPVTQVGPLPLPRATRYAMMVQSAVFMPGMYSLVHHHSGVEAVYVLEGEACFETPNRAATLRKGETLSIPGDSPMRAVVTGTARRHVLAIIVHDAAQPPTIRMEEGDRAQARRVQVAARWTRHGDLMLKFPLVATLVMLAAFVSRASTPAPVLERVDPDKPRRLEEPADRVRHSGARAVVPFNYAAQRESGPRRSGPCDGRTRIADLRPD